MAVVRCGQSQSELQQDLPRGVVAQICTAHHVGHALQCVVHHHGQLVSPQAIGAAQHKVAHLLGHVLPLWPQYFIPPFRHGRQALELLYRPNVQPPSARRFALQTWAIGRWQASAWVDGCRMARWLLALRGLNFFA